LNNYYRPYGRFSVFPPMIKNLLIINGAVFVLQLILQNGVMGGAFLLNKWFALNPINISGYDSWPFNFQVWQLISYQFMHAGFSHIFFNMFFLWMFGMEVENTWGPKKFLYYYLICGVAAGLAQLFIAPLFSTPAITIGASGAVFGVMIAFAMMFPDRYIFIWFLIPVKAKYLVGFFILAYNVLPILYGETSNVAHLAHLGGAVAGFIFILFDKNTYVSLKSSFKNLRGSGGGGNFSSTQSPFSGFADRFRKKEKNVEEAKYYDISNRHEEGDITQEEIDKILDKISKSGYQNLSEKEKKILFEASKKMR